MSLLAIIDGRRELIAVSSTGLIGDDVIQDTHHPTLKGYVALAGAVLREIENRHVFEQSKPIELPLDRGACAAYFEFDSDKWATVCERTSVHYERVAGYGYDPTERLGKSGVLARAARRIRAGTAPDALGIPGIGVVTPPTDGER